MTIIGKPPKTYYSRKELQHMTHGRLVSIVKENDWFQLLPGYSEDDWDLMPWNILIALVDTQMNHFREEVQVDKTKHHPDYH